VIYINSVFLDIDQC